MTNFEMYKNDLMKIEGRFAIDKAQRRITKCDAYINCKDCLFNDMNCMESDKIEWLYKEYEPPVLSDDELKLIKVLNKIMGKEYKYVARDVFGITRLFENKPSTNKTGNYSGAYTYVDIAAGDKVLFPNITHEYGVYDIENKCFIKEEGED